MNMLYSFLFDDVHGLLVSWKPTMLDPSLSIASILCVALKLLSCVHCMFWNIFLHTPSLFYVVFVGCHLVLCWCECTRWLPEFHCAGLVASISCSFDHSLLSCCIFGISLCLACH